MFESDADRLASIKALGGELAQVNERDVFVIFTDEHVPLQFGTFTVDGDSPQILGRKADLGVLDDNTLIVVHGAEYRIAGVEPDGVDGMTVVRLRKQ